MKILTGRRLEIATTGGGLAPEQIARARASYAARGFDVPEWTGPPLPDVAVEIPPAKPSGRPGVGTILKNMLARWGVRGNLGCGCNKLAAEMDAQGPIWCRRHLDQLAERLAENARRRKWMKLLPFKRYGARRLITRAIHAAEAPPDTPHNPTTDHARDHEEVEEPEEMAPQAGAFVAGDYRSPASLYNRDGRPVALHQVYRGAAAFLLCGGPSLADVAPDTFQQRGLLTMAVNNAAAVFRPHLWTYVDAPGKFIEQVWLDPAVLKFVPLKHFSKRIRVTSDRGELVDSAETIGALPSVFGYRRNGEFDATRFLSEASFSWGCAPDRKDDAGVSGTKTVFLVALKLLWFLGVRSVYLVGCDWSMASSRPYAFDQAKDAAAVASNNSLYRVTGQRLARLKPHFERAGLRIVNATPGSRLDVFERMPLEQAVAEATRRLPPQIITRGRY